MILRKMASFLLCATALACGRAEAKCEVSRAVTLHVVVEGNQILIPGKLGGENVKFLFDTSFPASVVMGPTARRLGLELLDYSSRAQRFYSEHKTEGAAIAPELDLDGHAIHHTLFAMFGERDSFGAPDVVAVLGNDFWRQFDVEVDLAKGEINLLRSSGCDGVSLAYWTDGYNVLDTHTSNYQSRFTTELNGHELTTILDTGSPFSTLTRRAALAAGVLGAEVAADVWHPNMQATDLLSLTALTYGLGTRNRPSADIQFGGTLDSPYNPVTRQTLANFGSLQLDQETIKPARFRITPTPKTRPEVGSRLGVEYFDFDVVLGVDFLLAHHVLIANSQDKLYFSYSGGSALQSLSK